MKVTNKTVVYLTALMMCFLITKPNTSEALDLKHLLSHHKKVKIAKKLLKLYLIKGGKKFIIPLPIPLPLPLP